MMTVFMVPTVRSKYGTKPNKIFNNDGKNLFLHWDSLRWEDVCLWQKAINKWALDDDAKYCISKHPGKYPNVDTSV